MDYYLNPKNFYCKIKIFLKMMSASAKKNSKITSFVARMTNEYYQAAETLALTFQVDKKLAKHVLRFWNNMKM